MSRDKLPKQDQGDTSGRYWNDDYHGLEVSLALGASALCEKGGMVVYGNQSTGIVAVFVSSIRTQIMEVVDEAA